LDYKIRTLLWVAVLIQVTEVVGLTCYSLSRLGRATSGEESPGNRL